MARVPKITVDPEMSRRWEEDARRGRIPRPEPRPKKTTPWQRWKTPILFLLASLFFEVGWVLSSWHHAQPSTYTICPECLPCQETP
jgi:hypothetical protein